MCNIYKKTHVMEFLVDRVAALKLSISFIYGGPRYISDIITFVQQLHTLKCLSFPCKSKRFFLNLSKVKKNYFVHLDTCVFFISFVLLHSMKSRYNQAETYWESCQTLYDGALAQIYLTFNAWCPPEGHTYLNKLAAESCRFV